MDEAEDAADAEQIPPELARHPPGASLFTPPRQVSKHLADMPAPDMCGGGRKVQCRPGTAGLNSPRGGRVAPRRQSFPRERAGIRKGRSW